MIIRCIIQNIHTNETKVIEQKGRFSIDTTMKLRFKIRKYRNKNWKIVKVETDNGILLLRLRKENPNINFSFIYD